ncbi:MAG: sulfotransferase [Rhodovibrionaceae bacterium]
MELTIIGAPRSGTTLFAAMIASHPEVSILNEDKTGAWRQALGGKHLGVKLCVPNQTERSAAEAEAARARLQALAAREAPRFSAWDRGRSEAWQEPLAAELLNDFLAREETRVLATLRAPERVVDSIQQRGGQPLAEALLRWLRALEIMGSLAETAPERFALVGFEQLVSDPERVLRACCAWLGLGFHAAMLTGETPFYHLQEIDPAKAGEADTAFQAQMAESFPEHWKTYESLRAGGLGRV